jgi:hypothetical protein
VGANVTDTVEFLEIRSNVFIYQEIPASAAHLSADLANSGKKGGNRLFRPEINPQISRNSKDCRANLF